MRFRAANGARPVVGYSFFPRPLGEGQGEGFRRQAHRWFSSAPCRGPRTIARSLKVGLSDYSSGSKPKYSYVPHMLMHGQALRTCQSVDLRVSEHVEQMPVQVGNVQSAVGVDGNGTGEFHVVRCVAVAKRPQRLAG